MANRTIGKLIIQIGTSFNTKGLDRAEVRTNQFATSVRSAIKGAFGVAAVASVVRFGKAAVEAWDTQQQAIAQVRQGLISTQLAAGKTLDELIKDASALQKTSLFGDEDILSNVTAQLLTFTDITADVFDRTQKATLDLATRFKVDLRSAAIQLGKALNDPVKGLSALTRTGVTFTAAEQEVIKSLAETNQLAEAQTLILEALEVQFGDSAQAAADAGTGPLKQLGMQFGDLTEDIGALIAVGLVPMAKELQNTGGFFDWFSEKLKGFNLVAQATFRVFGGGVAREFSKANEVVEESVLEFDNFGDAAVQLGIDLQNIPPPVKETVKVTEAAVKAASKAATAFKELSKEVDAFSDDLEKANLSAMDLAGQGRSGPALVRGIEDLGFTFEDVGDIVNDFDHDLEATLATMERLTLDSERLGTKLGDTFSFAADVVHDFTGTIQQLLATKGGPWGAALAGAIELAEAFGVDFNKILSDIVGKVKEFFTGGGITPIPRGDVPPEFTETQQFLRDEIAAINRIAAAMAAAGREYDAAAEKTRLLEAVIAELAAQGNLTAGQMQLFINMLLSLDEAARAAAEETRRFSGSITNFIDGLVGGGTVLGPPVGAGVGSADPFGVALFAALAEQLEKLRLTAEALSEPFNALQVEAGLIEQQIRALIKDGFKPGNPILDALIDRYTLLNKQLEKQSGFINDQIKELGFVEIAMEAYGASLAEIGRAFDLHGDEQRRLEEQIRATDQAMENLVDAVGDSTISAEEAAAAYAALDGDLQAFRDRLREIQGEATPAPSGGTTGGGTTGSGTVTPSGNIEIRFPSAFDLEGESLGLLYQLRDLQRATVAATALGAFSEGSVSDRLRAFASAIGTLGFGNPFQNLIAGSRLPVINAGNFGSTSGDGVITLRLVDSNFQEILTGAIEEVL